MAPKNVMGAPNFPMCPGEQTRVTVNALSTKLTSMPTLFAMIGRRLTIPEGYGYRAPLFINRYLRCGKGLFDEVIYQ